MGTYGYPFEPEPNMGRGLITTRDAPDKVGDQVLQAYPDMVVM